jgi:hypothetical protein
VSHHADEEEKTSWIPVIANQHVIDLTRMRHVAAILSEIVVRKTTMIMMTTVQDGNDTMMTTHAIAATNQIETGTGGDRILMMMTVTDDVQTTDGDETRVIYQTMAHEGGIVQEIEIATIVDELTIAVIEIEGTEGTEIGIGAETETGAETGAERRKGVSISTILASTLSKGRSTTSLPSL